MRTNVLVIAALFGLASTNKVEDQINKWISRAEVVGDDMKQFHIAQQPIMDANAQKFEA
jgi:hypothetical protein